MNWKRVAIVLAALVPLIGLLAFGLTRDPRELDSPLPGRAAPRFALPVFTDPTGQPLGRTVSLDQHRGQVVVLNFWASWCLACRDEHRTLSAVAERYRGRGVQFYGVLYNDSPENGERWIEEMGGQVYPGLRDAGARTAIDYGLYGVPETFFIAPDGRVAYKHVGPVTEAVLVQWIEKLRAPGQDGAS
ncbi:MAG TPA: redoxin domain-containing protein [Longimicrobium sp.]|jgi:cytochrome c biogenesis protein CcmG/thiol:disulfide interchange protein DsbE